MITVTIKRHTRPRNHPVLGQIEEKLPQYQIFGRVGENRPGLIGYVGTQENAPINLIVALPGDVQEEVKKQVKSQLSTAGDEVAIPPTDEERQLAQDPVDDRDDAEEADESTDEA